MRLQHTHFFRARAQHFSPLRFHTSAAAMDDDSDDAWRHDGGRDDDDDADGRAAAAADAAADDDDDDEEEDGHPRPARRVAGPIAVGGHLAVLEDVGRVVALNGFAEECKRLPFLCRSLQQEEDLLVALKKVRYGPTQRTLLMSRARYGDVHGVRTLLKAGADANAKDGKGDPVLAHAIDGRRPSSITKLLCKAGADGAADDGAGLPLLCHAILRGRKAVAVATALLDRGASPHPRSPQDPADPDKRAIDFYAECGPLRLAICKANVGVVRLLLSRGAAANQLPTDSDRVWAPLRFATGLSSIPAASLRKDVFQEAALARRGAVWGNRSSSGNRPEGQSSDDEDHEDADDAKAERRAELRAHERERRAALASATPPDLFRRKERFTKVVDVLLEGGADVAEVSGKGRETALHGAAMAGFEAAVRRLLAAGSPVDVPCAQRLTPLVGAVILQKVESARLLLAAGADPEGAYARVQGEAAADTRSAKSRVFDSSVYNSVAPRPLRHAAEAGNAALVDLLLAHGADVESRSHSSAAPLMQAIRGGHEAVVRLLVRGGAPVNEPAGDGSPLALACSARKAAMVRLLLELGADVNAADAATKNTALHVLAMCRGPLHAEPDDDDDDDGGGGGGGWPSWTAGPAARTGAGPVLRALVAAGADLAAENSDGHTPLLAAILAKRNFLSGHSAAVIGTVRALLLAGASPGARTRDGTTFPLKAALVPTDVYAGDERREAARAVSIARLLLSAGADPNARVATKSGERGDAPLLHFARGISAVRLLLMAGADPNGHDGRGCTALHIAAEVCGAAPSVPSYTAEEDDVYRTRSCPNASREDGLQIARLLLDWGASVNATMSATGPEGAASRVTPLHVAGSAEVADALLKHGASVTARDDAGWTPLHYAAARGNTSLAHRLLDERTSNIGARTVDGRTPLDCAAGARGRGGRIRPDTSSLIALLVRRGANVNERCGPDERSALHTACECLNDRAVTALLKAGANPSARDREGRTPLARLQALGEEAKKDSSWDVRNIEESLEDAGAV
jgi:ankyrin repeat protein